MIKKLIPALLGCILLTACTSSSGTVTVESSVEDFNMNNFSMPEKASIEAGQIIYDQNGLKITTDSLESDSAETFLILNLQNTSDQDITLTCESASINHFMIETPFSIDLPAGADTLTGINFTNTNLNACEISTVTEIDFTLTAYDYNDYTFLYETDRIHVETSQYGQYEQTVNTSGTSVYNKNGIQIISKGFTRDDHWGDVIALLVINNSDKNIYFGIEDGMATANGNEYEVSFGCNVPAGNNAIRYMYFQDADGSGVSDVSTASVTFSLTDTDSWKTIGTTPEIIFSKP